MCFSCPSLPWARFRPASCAAWAAPFLCLQTRSKGGVCVPHRVVVNSKGDGEGKVLLFKIKESPKWLRKVYSLRVGPA